MSIEIISLVLNFLIGSSLVVTITKLSTLKHDVSKAKYESENASLENEKKALTTFHEFIVEPLKKEINGLRKNIKKFEKAIEKVNSCSISSNCPVRNELQNSEESKKE